MTYEEIFITGKVPKALSKEEFEILFKQYKNGDESARQELIVHNLGLVISRISKRFYSQSDDLKKDLLSVGVKGLIRAISDFDPSKNVVFSTFAVSWIDGLILKFLSKENKNSGQISLDEKKYSDKNGKEITVGDQIQDTNANIVLNYEDKEMIYYIYNLIDELPSREKDIIRLYFGLDGNRRCSQIQLAEMFNITQAQVSRIVNNNIKELRQKLYEQVLLKLLE